MKVIDAKGRACPEPVLMAKRALKEDPQGFDIVVDNIVAAENVTRFAQNQGCQVNRTEDGDTFTLSLRKSD